MKFTRELKKFISQAQKCAQKIAPHGQEFAKTYKAKISEKIQPLQQLAQDKIGNTLKSEAAQQAIQKLTSTKDVLLNRCQDQKIVKAVKELTVNSKKVANLNESISKAWLEEKAELPGEINSEHLECAQANSAQHASEELLVYGKSMLNFASEASLKANINTFNAYFYETEDCWIQ